MSDTDDFRTQYGFIPTVGRDLTLTKGLYFGVPAVALFIGEDSRPIILAGEAGRNLANLIVRLLGEQEKELTNV